MTLSAALDAGLYSLNSVFSGTDATGPLTVDSHTFPATINNLAECGQSPPITLTIALACSDNITFATIGLKLGASRFLDYAHRFGLDQPTPFDIPVSESHVQTQGETFSQVALASTAFGQGGLHVTPLQMLMIAESAADGGRVPRPVLVKHVSAPDGSTVQTADEGTLYTPVSSDTASQVRDAMVQVVQVGSGYAAKIPGVQVAGKTGTAETGDGRPPHAWFVCFAPADHPRVAVVVMIEHAGEGAIVAAPIAHQILLAALQSVH
jgi:peptidoglycan glycosyltransferase